MGNFAENLNLGNHFRPLDFADDIALLESPFSGHRPTASKAAATTDLDLILYVPETEYMTVMVNYHPHPTLQVYGVLGVLFGRWNAFGEVSKSQSLRKWIYSLPLALPPSSMTVHLNSPGVSHSGVSSSRGVSHSGVSWSQFHPKMDFRNM